MIVRHIPSHTFLNDKGPDASAPTPATRGALGRAVHWPAHGAGTSCPRSALRSRQRWASVFLKIPTLLCLETARNARRFCVGSYVASLLGPRSPVVSCRPWLPPRVRFTRK